MSPITLCRTCQQPAKTFNRGIPICWDCLEKQAEKPYHHYDDDACESVRVATYEDAADYGKTVAYQPGVDYATRRTVVVDAMCASEPLVTAALEQLEQLEMRLGRIVNRCTSLSMAGRGQHAAFLGDQSVVRLARDVIVALRAKAEPLEP